MMQDLEQRVAILENLVYSLINKIDNNKNDANLDISSIRYVNNDQNTDIANNRSGIEEVYVTSETNSEDISDVRTAIEEVYEMIMEE